MKNRMRLLAVACAALMVTTGCASQNWFRITDDVKAKPFPAGAYTPKMDRFEVILDSSASMEGNYLEREKFYWAQEILHRIFETVPDLPMDAGLRTFGHGSCFPDVNTILHRNLMPYDQKSMLSAIDGIPCIGGNSRLDSALEAAMTDLAGKGGKNGVIIVSDGKEMGQLPLPAAQSLVARLGPETCIHTIQIGDDPVGGKLLSDLSGLTPCGVSVNADALVEASGMAGFVEKVFLSKMKDSDGDGVYDGIDRCPDTPKGVPVDAYGCPIVKDSDGDGVSDDKDKCPDTPRGAKVNAEGCWVLKNVTFDWDKWDIKPQFYDELAEVVQILKRLPTLKVEIQGHTDNTGTRAHNQELSEKRAKSVQTYLVRHGIESKRLKTMGFGATRPVDTNQTPTGRSLNRRVEFRPIH
jgi:OmpA-OmpF porin, OOP family